MSKKKNREILNVLLNDDYFDVEITIKPHSEKSTIPNNKAFIEITKAALDFLYVGEY